MGRKKSICINEGPDSAGSTAVQESYGQGINNNNVEMKSPIEEDSNEPVRFRKEIGLIEAVALIVGCMIGSGIFVSPKGVYQIMNSVGGSLAVWLGCGLISLSAALCFVELGLALPKSGGSYYYLLQVLGPCVAFMYLWAQIIIFIPTGNVILGLAFANYVVQIFFPSGCHLPEASLKLIAAASIMFLVFLNCYNIRGITRLQNVLMIAKIMPLVFIIVIGIWVLGIEGGTTNIVKPFDSTNLDPGSISLALYSGLFAYGGWGVLNNVTEEIKNPNKNIPRAIYISVPIVTLIYIMANVGYFVVLTPDEFISSDAVAATFAKKILSPFWSFLMPMFVAFSTFGVLSIHIMANSRQLFVGARHGHFPLILAQINVFRLTPDTSLIFLGGFSFFYLITSDIYALINYTSYIHNVSQLAVIFVIFYIRRKDSNHTRPVQVSIVHPIIFLLSTVFLIIFPLYASPIESAVSLLIGATGLPVYFLFIKGTKKNPEWVDKLSAKVTMTIQKLCLCVPED